MGAPAGNQFWKQRTKHGRDKLFSDSKVLEMECEAYFEWCDSNPWVKNEAVKAGDHFGELVHVPTVRPYTIKGLCLYLDIDETTLSDYEKNKDFSRIISRVKNIIYTQKFEGATVGAFNANIISRELGLTEKTENIHKLKGAKIVIRGRKAGD